MVGAKVDETQSSTSVKTEADHKRLEPKYGAMSGIWIFGGMNKSKKPMNDIYLI
jgi:hypothetical protein